MRRKRNHAGIRVRHGRGCAGANGGSCSCRPSYEAWVFSARDNKKLRKSFPTLAAAKAWRADASVALRERAIRAPTPITLRQAAEIWLRGANEQTIRTRSGDPYKPSALRGYEAALRTKILPKLGNRKLCEVDRADIQSLADALLADGLDASTIRNALMPLRVIFRRALTRGEVAINPTSGIELPAVRGKRERIATPLEAEQLLAALPA